MAKRQAFSLSSVFFLQLVIGVFFLVLGILGVQGHDSTLSEIKRALGRNDSFQTITAIVELVAGIILLVGLFVSISGDLQRLVSLVLFCLWALILVINYFVNNFAEPDFLPWLRGLSLNSVVLVGLWVIGRR